MGYYREGWLIESVGYENVPHVATRIKSIFIEGINGDVPIKNA